MSGSRVPALRRSMGIVFQDYKLLPTRTVLENVTYVLKFLGVPRGRAPPARLPGAPPRRAPPPARRASRGALRRRAAARRPGARPRQRARCSSSPTSRPGNLDHRLAREVMKLFAEINVRGTTVLVATHDQDLVQAAGAPLPDARPRAASSRGSSRPRSRRRPSRAARLGDGGAARERRRPSLAALVSRRRSQASCARGG